MLLKSSEAHEGIRPRTGCKIVMQVFIVGLYGNDRNSFSISQEIIMFLIIPEQKQLLFANFVCVSIECLRIECYSYHVFYSNKNGF